MLKNIKHLKKVRRDHRRPENVSDRQINFLCKRFLDETTTEGMKMYKKDGSLQFFSSENTLLIFDSTKKAAAALYDKEGIVYVGVSSDMPKQKMCSFIFDELESQGVNIRPFEGDEYMTSEMELILSKWKSRKKRG